MNPLPLLRDMIAVPSVNPMRANSGEPVESEMAEYIEGVLRRAGIDVERQTVAAGRDNIIGVVHPTEQQSRSRRGLMLNSHMDTVPVSNMAIDPFDPRVSNGCVYGRGSCDAKASLAAMLSALISYTQKSERAIPVVFAAMADEEFSFGGSWKLIEKEWPVSSCIVGEPTKLARVIAHKGAVRWRIQVTGISAHGATPGLGRSAIYDGARVALALEEYAGRLTAAEAHPLLGHGTINVGRVTGGQSVNIVPDRCVFEMERRLLPDEDGRHAVLDCESFVRSMVGPAVELSIEEPYLIDPALDTNSDAQVVRKLGDTQQFLLGTASTMEGANYCTDGSKLAKAGIETVVCGPGDIAHAHTANEHVLIEEVEVAARLYEHLLLNWTN